MTKHIDYGNACYSPVLGMLIIYAGINATVPRLSSKGNFEDE